MGEGLSQWVSGQGVSVLGGVGVEGKSTAQICAMEEPIVYTIVWGCVKEHSVSCYMC